MQAWTLSLIHISQGHVFSPDPAEKPVAQLQKIYNVFDKASPILEGKLSVYITKLLNNFLFLPAERRKSRNTGASMSEIISYINEHFQQDLSLDVLASKTNMSIFHFTRSFTRETGISPHQYIIKTRLSAAKYLLKSTETSIKDIAFSTGFNSESSFCITFKKWEHVTPSQYRQETLE